MAEKIRVKGRLRLPISGVDPSFAQLRFAKAELSEKDILPDSADIFTCDLEGNYDFEIYTGAHLFSHTSGKEWSEPVELIVEPLSDGLSHVRISDLIGFQSIPELDDVTSALNQQKQELLLIQKQIEDSILVAQESQRLAEEARDAAESARTAAEEAAASEYATGFQHYVQLPEKVTIPALGLTDAEIEAYVYDSAIKYSPVNSSGENCYATINEFGLMFNCANVPEGTNANIVFLANAGTQANVKSTAKVNLLRYNHAYAQYRLVSNLSGGGVILVSARDWGDNYTDRSEYPVRYGSDTFGMGAINLRIVNLGTEQLEIFGLGLVVRKA